MKELDMINFLWYNWHDEYKQEQIRYKGVPCAIDEFFRKEREAGRNTSSCMMVCNCPKCVKLRGTL